MTMPTLKAYDIAMHDSLTPDPADRLQEAADRIAQSIRLDPRMQRSHADALPDVDEIQGILAALTDLCFPGFFQADVDGAHPDGDMIRRKIDLIETRLRKQISDACRFERLRVESPEASGPANSPECRNDCDAVAARLTRDFFAEFSVVRDMVSLDVQAAFDGDPAAHHTDEVILCYPGLRAIIVHRIAHLLRRLGVPLLPRMMAEIAHSETGIDIHPGARIGRSFFVDHGTGVVIGETTLIGDHCTIYQGVTLGAKNFPRGDDGEYDRSQKRHPTLEDHVTVYAGATILGGETVIGSGSVVNGGVFVTTSVPPAHVVRAPKIDIRLRSNPNRPPASYSI